MSEKELLRKIGQLETVNDFLVTEIEHLDELMRLVGFKGGISTVKATANEIIKRGAVEVEESL